MTIYESELALVKARLEDINKEKSRPGNKKIGIAAGDPVVEEYKDEYIALKRMQEILENNFQQAEDYEYLNARKITKLPALPAGMEERFVHSSTQDYEHDFGPAPAPATFMSPEEVERMLKGERSQGPGHIMSQEEIQEMLRGGLGRSQITGSAPAPAPAPVQGGKLTQEEIERIMGGDSQQQPEPAPQPAHAPETTTPPIQQQDNLIHITPEQLEQLITDSVVRTLTQLNLSAHTQAPVVPQPEQQQTPEPPPENPTPSEQSDQPEQVPDLTPEQQAAMAQAMIHGIPEHTVDDDDDLEPIVKVTKWQWIKNHKKPILIALGITAMALSVALGIHNLLPALKVIDSSQALANLGGQMIENSKLASLGVDHLSLHSANTALAEQITEMSQIKHTFDAASGTWTFGTKVLPDFVTAQLTKASEAREAVSAIKTAMTAGGLTGLGLFGTGLVMPRAKSQEFKDIAKEIKDYPENIEFTTTDDLDAKHDALARKIKKSTTLKEWEKKKLLKKLKKTQKKVDYEIEYRDDPNFEEGMALGEELSEHAGHSL